MERECDRESKERRSSTYFVIYKGTMEREDVVDDLENIYSLTA